ncbi:MAG: NAD(P)H-dependent oxidoreductase [Deltaproteobacteria bacterium]|nr:NAD(P)H-dependent oxidoreductase [Deltaproteobacteria bacterium]
MQILILYYSKGSNTKKLAEAIAKGVKQVDGVAVLLKTTDEVTNDDLLSSQGIIAGSPVYFGTMSAELKKVFDETISIRKKMEGKIGAAFATSGDLTGGKETTIMSIMQAMLINGMIIVGDPMSAGGHYGVACAGEPGERTTQNAAKLGIRVAELVKRLFS